MSSFLAKKSRPKCENPVPRSSDEWERMWALYDEPTYTAVLKAIGIDDTVLEIGAGDLRLARRIARRAQKIYAIERNKDLAAGPKPELPANCQVIAADARWIPFPEDISVAVLLMRHCTSLAQYWNKLAATKCKKLITNARWGLGVEIIDLTEARLPFHSVPMGWYACHCGSVGFLPGAVELITDQVMDRVWEVNGCPACQSRYLPTVLHERSGVSQYS